VERNSMTAAAGRGESEIRDCPYSLRTAAALALDSPHPACLAWGNAQADIRNEPFRELCRSRLPPGPGNDSGNWRLIWPAAAAALERARAGEASCVRESSWHHAEPAPRRHQFSFTAVPVRDEDGVARGALITVVDLTAATELERATRELDALNYALSHDLQSPIGTLRELIRILLAEDPAVPPVPPAEAKSFLSHLASGTAKLNQRVDALVRLARISRKPLVYRRVDVAKLVESLCQKLSNARPGAGVEYIVAALPPVMGDADLLAQAFEHVLSNAFKFTRDVVRPHIEIGSREESGQIVYFIVDNGAGFDMKFAGRLFGLYQRLHTDAEFEGTGVGLALARRIVELHGGTLQGTAVRLQGATFSIALPALEPLRA
jgi:signal transduction histidine kinase